MDNRSLITLIRAHQPPEVAKEMRRGVVFHVTKWTWLAIFLVLVIAVGILSIGAAITKEKISLTYLLPGASWLDFQGGAGPDYVGLRADEDPAEYRIPRRVQPWNARNFREVISDCLVKPEELTDRTEHKMFLITFTDRSEVPYTLRFWDDGLIEINDACYRDSGKCYKLLRWNFGSQKDWEKWCPFEGE